MKGIAQRKGVKSTEGKFYPYPRDISSEMERFIDKEVYFSTKKEGKGRNKIEVVKEIIELKSFSPFSIKLTKRPKNNGSINFSLLFNKYWWKWKWEKKEGFVSLELLKGSEELEELKEAFPDQHKREFQIKMDKFLSALKKQVGDENFWEDEFTTTQRLVLGLGAEHLHETSIILHHIFGVPYIPATALKGAVRSYVVERVIWEPLVGELPEEEIKEIVCREKGKCEDYRERLKNTIDGWIDAGGGWEERVKNKEIKTSLSRAHKIFGGKNEKGLIRFLDAYPTKLILAVDVMNPHYPKYYQENKAPSDWQNPVPIFFLTVDKGSKFKFAFFVESSQRLAEKAGKELKAQTEKWLKEALREYGLGAKTALGYGLFR